MRRVEHPENTPEQVRGYLDDALAVVRELDPPEDLRVPLFVKAADLIAAKHVTFEQVQAVPRGMIVPGAGGRAL